MSKTSFKIMINNLKILFTFILLVILFSCKRNTERSFEYVFDSDSEDLPTILKNKELKVLIEYSPTSYYYYKGTNMGFEFEMLKAFASDLGVRLKIEKIKNIDEAEKELIFGDANILACSYTITKDRKEHMDFSTPYMRTPQVLIQRMPWDENPSYIKDPIMLTGKEIVVSSKSSYYQRLLHLQDEMGDSIHIVGVDRTYSPKKLMDMVSQKKIDYTVVDNHIAVASAFEYNNLDHHLRLSFKQQIAFGLKKNSPLLRFKLNKWIRKFRQTPHFRFLKHKYFFGKELSELTYQDYLELGGGKLSPYDKIFKKEAKKHNLEWQLVAAVVQQESNFKPYIKGKGGAFGLMQFMPKTGKKYGVHPDSSPSSQIKAGTKKIKNDLKFWSKVPNKQQRIKFALATYNAGHVLIEKAQKRAVDMGLDPLIWDNHVEKALRKRKGGKSIHYVQQVYKRYRSFLMMYE
jgi:membrane-bound lytic murein transglycosylase F